MDMLSMNENKILLTIDEECMEASIYITPSENEQIKKEEIHKVLEENGVKYGLLPYEIEKVVTEELYCQNVIVAKGKKPIDGSDGFYKFNFNQNFSRKPKINEDGTINYLELSMYEEVEQDKLIASYYKATKGIMGFTIKGKLILPKNGKDIPPIKGKNFYLSEDGIHYYAEVTGTINLTDDNNINIEPIYVHKGNLTVKDGNIHFKKNVHVTGNVESGLSIIAGGDIVIDGVVESSKIISGGDIIIRKGCLGAEKCIIEGKGNLSASFLEAATVHVEKDINCGNIIRGNVTADGKIHVLGKRAAIIAGITYGKSGIIASQIGNSRGIKTVVRAGVTENNQEKYKEFKKRIEKIQNELSIFYENLIETHPYYDKIVLAVNTKEEELLKVKEELRMVLEKAGKASNATVICKHNIYPGTIIDITGEYYSVTEELMEVRFYKHNGKINKGGLE
ncbi:MAG: DUF342 domain-containing protein [Lachnospiraceae bacterium]